MTLREYISHLNKMVENKPALLDVEMVCASETKKPRTNKGTGL